MAPAVVLIALVTVTLAAYHPAWHGGIVWDDDHHLTRPELQSLGGLWRIWFDVGATQQYYPLAHTAFWIQQALWGYDTLGYHLVNICLHALSAFLLYRILAHLAVPGAIAAAFLFALHPVHVESVAWITELKNTLSGFFYLAAALVYLRFDATRAGAAWWRAFILYLLALFAKTVTATLPAALLVVFWWQRGRLEWRRDVQPLLPFFVIGIAAGLLTAWVERWSIGAEGVDFQLTAVERLLIAARAVWFYLGKLLWPADLAFIYPRWNVDAAAVWQYVFPLAALLALAVLWALRRRSRALLAAALLFGGTLFPALGFVDVYPFRYAFVADHFQYLASISVLALVAAASVRLLSGRVAPATATLGITIAFSVPLAILTWKQSHLYVSAEALYAGTIERNPSAWMAHNNLAEIEMRDPQADLNRPIERLRTALALKPDYPEARANLGAAYHRLGRLEEAAAEYRAVLAADPRIVRAEYNLGLVLLDLGRPHDAVVRLQRAVSVTRDPDGYIALANAHRALGRTDEAIAQYREALRASPQSALAHTNLALAFLEVDRLEDAARHLRQAVRLVPTDAGAHAVLGNVLHRLGQIEEAIDAYDAALTYGSGPETADVHNAYGVLLMQINEFEEAVRHFEAALRLRPDFADARANLARASTMKR